MKLIILLVTSTGLLFASCSKSNDTHCVTCKTNRWTPLNSSASAFGWEDIKDTTMCGASDSAVSAYQQRQLENNPPYNTANYRECVCK